MTLLTDCISSNNFSVFLWNSADAASCLFIMSEADEIFCSILLVLSKTFCLKSERSSCTDLRPSPTNAVESALCDSAPISVSILSILPASSFIDSRLTLSTEPAFVAIVSNCCFRPSITPPRESIFDAFDDMASIVTLIASNSELRLELSETPSVIFESSCFRLSII